MQNSTIDVHLTSKDSGAEISGVDLARPLAEPTYREIRHLLADRGVVFFREQELTPEQLLALGKQFGEIHISKLIAKVPGHPLVAEVRKEPEQTRNTGGNWHSDHAYVDKPPLGSILLARELPPLGGDTMFANMCAAYDSLSDGLKKTLDGLKAVHAKKKALDNSNLSAERKVGTKERARLSTGDLEEQAIHPVAPRHPETGRKVLFVNPTYTVRFDGWSEAESKPLLTYLYQHAARPENICRFHWEVGSIAFWDNRTSWHYALNDYHGSRRLMYRVSVQGSGFAAP
jgi:taurine dioxygenase